MVANHGIAAANVSGRLDDLWPFTEQGGRICHADQRKGNGREV